MHELNQSKIVAIGHPSSSDPGINVLDRGKDFQSNSTGFIRPTLEPVLHEDVVDSVELGLGHFDTYRHGGEISRKGFALDFKWSIIQGARQRQETP